MNLELALILGFLAHLVGDYIIQNDWMALNKKNSWWPCFVHCATYALCFYPLVGLSVPLLLIFWTHYIIDRHKMVDWFLAARNNVWHIRNFGFNEERPVFITIWLYIITDNIFHILINSACIYWHFNTL